MINTVSSIIQLQNFAGAARSVLVKDELRGGVFNYTRDILTPDNGIIFEAGGVGEGYWVREITQTKGWNVKWWGAVGDGVANDTAAIQMAMDTIPSEGGSLYFPSGLYLCPEGGLVANNQIFFIGDSGYSYQFGTGGVPPLRGSIIISESTTTDLLVCETACSFSDISFRNTSVTEPTAGVGIKLSHAGSFSMHNTQIMGFYDLLHIRKGTRWNISNSNFWFPKHYGIYINNPNDVVGWTDTGDTSIAGGSIITNKDGVTGIRFESSGGLKITNFKINPLDSTRLGIGIDTNIIAPGTSILLLNNVSIEGWSGNGVLVDRQVGAEIGKIVIVGCQFYPVYNGITGHPVNLNNVTGVTVIANDFADAGANTNAAIKLTNVTNATIWPNTFTGWTNKYSITGGSNVVSEPVKLTTDNVIFNTPASYNSSTNTLTLALKSQTANALFAGPASGSNAAPTFRKMSRNDARNLFGAATTAAVADFNDISNLKPGFNDLLLGSAANGPGGAEYYTPFVVEYGTAKDGTGDLFEMLLPFTNSTGGNAIWYRYRQAGTFTGWFKLLTGSDQTVNSSMTTAQTAATLNSTYPSAPVMFRVYAPNVGTGMQYVKTSVGGQWIATTGTTLNP